VIAATFVDFAPVDEVNIGDYLELVFDVGM